MAESTKNQKSIAVVGAGIVGVCIALYLQKNGKTVTIYDGKGPAEGASKGNAGHFATEQVFPLADVGLLPQVPKMLMDPLGPFRIKLSYLFKAIPWFARFLLNMRQSKFNQNKAAIKSLNEASMAAYKPLIEDAGITHLFHKQGSLLVSEQDSDNALKEAYQAFKANDVNATFLNQKQLLAMEPNLSKQVKHGIYFSDVGHTTDPALLTKALFQHFLTSGGEFVNLDVQEVLQDKNNAVVKSGDKTFSHELAIIATGAWSKPLVKKLGYRVPLDTERGYHLMVPEQETLSIPVASLERKFIMTPMLSGLRLAGTVEFAGLEAPANNARAHALLPHAKALLTQPLEHNATDLPNWMGFRPSLPDSLPVIGKAPNHQHIYFAFGHQHLGLTQAAITGQVISELINQEKTSLDLSPFCISRFNN